MDKKKIGLLIIVLFLIIGLGSFVFANPDNQENLEEGDVEERDRLGSDKDSDDEEVLNEDTESDTLLTNGLDNQGSSFGNVQGNISNVNDGTGFTTGPSDDSNGNTEVPVTPDYYADALKAVENAESSLVQGDVDYAASLVDKLTNQSQKDELNKRLEAVQDIIDVTALIERLEEMVANSTNRDGILDSIDYRDNEKIEELVNDLINGNAKDDLVDRLETVNKILNDNKGPVISGIENNSFTKDDVSLTISDDNEVTTKVTLNGEEVEYTDTFTEEGTYVVTVVDAAFNETTLTFTIDKTAPEFVGLKNGMFYQNDITVEVSDKNLDKITAKVYADNYNVVEIENNSTLTKESIYLLTATDKAGNTTSIYVAVDKTAPVFTTVKNGHQYNEDIKLDVKDLKVKTIEVYSYNDKTTKTVDNGYVLTEEGTYRVTATDYSGRSTTVYVTIDKTAPSINGFEDGSYNNKSEIVYISDENLYKVTINGTEYDHDGKYFTKKLVSDGVYTIVATDRAGNITTKTVTIDKTAPEFEDPQKTMESDVTIKVIEDNLDKILVTDKISGETYEVENGHILTKEGYYKIIAYDKAGNQSDVWNLTIDNAAPVITIEDARENGYYNHDVVVNISDIELQQTYLNGERMGREDTLTIEDEGTYTVYAEDRYGHKSEEVTFTIDKTAPTITVDKLVNGVTDDGNVTVKDANDFEVVVKYNNVEKVRTTASVSKRFNISWLGEGTFEVIATDMAGNTETITFELNLLNLTAQAVGSNLIDEANNTINNFNAFAIKFDKDLTFNVASKNQKYIIEMEYSTDGVHYTKSNYKYDNQYQGLNDGNGNKYGNGLFNSYTISANSSIHWSGTKVGARWTDIYEAIKATKDTDNKVYVRTIFTVVQPSFTKSFTLDEVVYSKGGYEVTPRGLPQI